MKFEDLKIEDIDFEHLCQNCFAQLIMLKMGVCTQCKKSYCSECIQNEICTRCREL